MRQVCDKIQAKVVKQMGYSEDMARCRDYIAEHLQEELTPAELADRFGYSYYHFCHVFRSVNGIAVAEYLRDRRLCAAASQLLLGSSVTETAMDSGFDTVSGFTRAFTRKFGLAPSVYKKTKGARFGMKPEMKHFPAFTAVGYILKPESEVDVRENSAYWLGKDFSGVSKEDYAKLSAAGCGEVGLWIHPAEKGEELFYFFGPVVKSEDFVPSGMKALNIPEAEYAVFQVPKGSDAPTLHENVKKTWRFIFNDWFDDSGYTFDHSKFDFEYYRGEETYIYVPVRKH